MHIWSSISETGHPHLETSPRSLLSLLQPPPFKPSFLLVTPANLSTEPPHLPPARRQPSPSAKLPEIQALDLPLSLSSGHRQSHRRSLPISHSKHSTSPPLPVAALHRLIPPAKSSESKKPPLFPLLSLAAANPADEFRRSHSQNAQLSLLYSWPPFAGRSKGEPTKNPKIAPFLSLSSDCRRSCQRRPPSP